MSYLFGGILEIINSVEMLRSVLFTLASRPGPDQRRIKAIFNILTDPKFDERARRVAAERCEEILRKYGYILSPRIREHIRKRVI